MPKAHRGGQAATPVPPPPPPPSPQQDDDDNTTPAPKLTPNQLWKQAQRDGKIDLSDSGYTLADLQNMSDDDLHDMMLAITKQEVPDYLMPNAMQKMVYALNMNDAPIVEPDAVFQKNSKGQTIIYNAQNNATLSGFTLTADDIHDFIRYGDETLVQNGVYGNGIYFSDSRTGSAGYGSRQARARLNPAKAKVVTYSKLQSEYDAWIASRPRTRKALGATKASNKGYGTNTFSQFAVLRGYNVIATKRIGGETYYAVLDRSALIYSDGTRDSHGRNTW